MLLFRRIAAAALVVAALVLAFRPAGSAVPVVVAARDLPPGAALGPGDLVVRDWPTALAPAGNLPAEEAEGRVLSGAVRAGEPITDLRVAGPALAARVAGLPDATGVPVRLADPDVAALLAPGSRVDVVATGEGDEPAVLARDAVVLAVPGAASTKPGLGGGGRGSLVVVALPGDLAARVASASLSADVTVTLR